MADVTPVSTLPPGSSIYGTAQEASLLLRVSRSQVYRLMDEGVIESVRVGNRRLAVWESVLALIVPEGSAS